MIRHVTLFAWNEGTSDEQEHQLASALRALAPRLSGVRALHVGPDAGIIDGNYDFAVVGDFDDAESYLAYRNHPEHQDILKNLSTPMTRHRVSVQYEI